MKEETVGNYDFSFKKKEGMVLVLVLILLAGAIVLGIEVLYEAQMGCRIAGNNKAYVQDYYEVDGGVKMVEAGLLTQVVTTLGLNTSSPYYIDKHVLPASLSEDTIHVHLKKEGKVLPNKGFNADMFKARYYEVTAEQNGHEVDAGIWKPFPKENVVMIEE